MDERSNGNSRMILTVSVNFNHCGGSGNPDFSAPSPTSCCWNQLRLLPSPQRGVFLRARELEAGFVELRRRKQTLFPPHPSTLFLRDPQQTFWRSDCVYRFHC